MRKIALPFLMPVPVQKLIRVLLGLLDHRVAQVSEVPKVIVEIQVQRDQMDPEVKLVFLDLRDLRDHKDPADFLFKDFQVHQVKRERREILVFLACRVSQEPQVHLEEMELKVKGAFLAKMDPQAHKDLLAQWAYLVLQVFQVLQEARGHKVMLELLVLLDLREKGVSGVISSPKQWCVLLLVKCVNNSSRVIWLDITQF